jgi:hypothetical protein
MANGLQFVDPVQPASPMDLDPHKFMNNDLISIMNQPLTGIPALNEFHAKILSPFKFNLNLGRLVSPT